MATSVLSACIAGCWDEMCWRWLCFGVELFVERGISSFIAFRMPEHHIKILFILHLQLLHLPLQKLLLLPKDFQKPTNLLLLLLPGQRQQLPNDQIGVLKYFRVDLVEFWMLRREKLGVFLLAEGVHVVFCLD